MELSDLAVVIVAFKSAPFLEACLSSLLAHMGILRLDVVVIDVGPPDGTAEIVRRFPAVRFLRGPNLGFAYANNCALATTNARYVLFLNPDTVVLRGSLGALVHRMDARPDVGLAGVRQVDHAGQLALTIRRFPNALRALGDALAAEALPGRPHWLGERELERAAYDREVECDWTSGSFMLARREAIESAGIMDERFFLYSEETDFCRRIRRAGWGVHHLPWMTIRHYGATAADDPERESLKAYSRMLYAYKHFSRLHRAAYHRTLLLRYATRALIPGGGECGCQRRTANRAAVKTLLHLSSPPPAPRSRSSVSPKQLVATADHLWQRRRRGRATISVPGGHVGEDLVER